MTVFTVSSLADDGPGTLRADIKAAKAGETIEFAPSLAGGTAAHGRRFEVERIRAAVAA